MTGPTFLGVDVGTSSVKVAIVDQDLGLFALERSGHTPNRPREGWAEVSLEAVWEIVVGLVRRLAVSSPDATRSVRSIGLSVLCPGLAALDADGRPLTGAMTFMDRRSIAEASELATRIPPEDFFRISANRLMPGSSTVTGMLWIKRNQPAVYEHTRYFGHVNTFLAHRMTGDFGLDPSSASYTGLFDTRGGISWSAEAIERAGIDAGTLPPIVPSASAVGLLACPTLEAAGLPAGIPVAMGGGDTACAALAIGALNRGDVFESAGTTNVVSICSETPVFDERFVNRCHVVPRRWLSHGAMSSTGAALLWLRDELFKERSRETFDAALDAAGALPSSSAIPVFLPYMAGERSPVWDPFATGVFLGLSLDTRREHLIRAVMEGCAFGTRQLLGIAEEALGVAVSEIPSIGGGAKIEPWTQIKADVTGRTFTVLDLNDAAAVGAAMLGAVAGGYRDPTDIGEGCRGMAPSGGAQRRRVSLDPSCRVWKRFAPDQTGRASYDRRYAIYLELYPRLHDLFRR